MNIQNFLFRKHERLNKERNYDLLVSISKISNEDMFNITKQLILIQRGRFFQYAQRIHIVLKTIYTAKPFTSWNQASPKKRFEDLAVRRMVTSR